MIRSAWCKVVVVVVVVVMMMAEGDARCIAYGVGLVYIHTCGHFRHWVFCGRFRIFFVNQGRGNFSEAKAWKRVAGQDV